ncbi:DUF300-domain-containing protein [Meredithblackwellia eburnea MCA 4105]
MVLTNHTCPAENTNIIDQEAFWNGNWDAHKVGWLIAGATAAVSTVITLVQFFLHARNYYVPKEQRQILRIILMPPVYAVISFFSYRYFRSYTYYQLVVVVYESLVPPAFLMLLLQFIGDSNEEQRRVLLEKDKRKIPFPFCCIKFRPSKPYFLHALKWSVLQYSLLRPLISLAGVITNAFDVLCPTQYSVYFAEVYLDSVDFVSISVALYGLIVFYALVKERLAGKAPLLKFLSIKGIVMITFYQGFVFGVLQDYNVIKGTQYWTATNVADGLQALCTCCEMVIFSLVFLKAFSHRPYAAARPVGEKSTSVFWAFIDSINYSDFLIEGWKGVVFAVRFMLGRPGTRSVKGPLNIDDAFHGISGEKNLKGSSGGDADSDGSSHPMRFVGQHAQQRSSEDEEQYYAQREQQAPQRSRQNSSIPGQAFGRGSSELEEEQLYQHRQQSRKGSQSSLGRRGEYQYQSQQPQHYQQQQQQHYGDYGYGRSGEEGYEEQQDESYVGQHAVPDSPLDNGEMRSSAPEDLWRRQQAKYGGDPSQLKGGYGHAR